MEAVPSELQNSLERYPMPDGFVGFDSLKYAMTSTDSSVSLSASEVCPPAQP